MNVFQHLPRGRAGQRHAQSAGDQRQHVRGPLQIFMGAGHAGKAVLDLAAPGLTQPRTSQTRRAQPASALLRRAARLPAARRPPQLRFRPGNLLNVVPEGRRGRNPSGRGVRLLQQARLAQRGHHVANGGGTQPLPVGKAMRNRLRSHRFAGGDVELDDGRKHQPLARTDARIRHLPCSPSRLPRDKPCMPHRDQTCLR